MKRKFISVILSGAIITSTAASVMAQDYVVKKGDTLCSIARNFNTTYQVLAEINNIENPNLIFPNQVLKTAETAQVMPSKDKTEEVLSVNPGPARRFHPGTRFLLLPGQPAPGGRNRCFR